MFGRPVTCKGSPRVKPNARYETESKPKLLELVEAVASAGLARHWRMCCARGRPPAAVRSRSRRSDLRNRCRCGARHTSTVRDRRCAQRRPVLVYTEQPSGRRISVHPAHETSGIRHLTRQPFGYRVWVNGISRVPTIRTSSAIDPAAIFFMILAR